MGVVPSPTAFVLLPVTRALRSVALPQSTLKTTLPPLIPVVENPDAVVVEALVAVEVPVDTAVVVVVAEVPVDTGAVVVVTGPGLTTILATNGSFAAPRTNCTVSGEPAVTTAPNVLTSAVLHAPVSLNTSKSRSTCPPCTTTEKTRPPTAQTLVFVSAKPSSTEYVPAAMPANEYVKLAAPSSPYLWLLKRSSSWQKGAGGRNRRRCQYTTAAGGGSLQRAREGQSISLRSSLRWA
jgi:hypothetical protein